MARTRSTKKGIATRTSDTTPTPPSLRLTRPLNYTEDQLYDTGTIRYSRQRDGTLGMKAPSATNKLVFCKERSASTTISESGESQDDHPEPEQDSTTGEGGTDDADEEILDGGREGEDEEQD